MTNGTGEADVVLVPGFMQSSRSWQPVLERIGRRYRARGLEHRTHDFVGRLAEIEAAVPRGAAVVGYSLGGRLVLHAALRAADDSNRFACVVILGASAGIEDRDERAERRRADERLAEWIEATSIEEVVAHWERIPTLAAQDPDLIAAQRADRLTRSPRALATLLRSAGQGAVEPVWHRLGELRAPLLALAGERDHRYLAAARRLAVAVPFGRAGAVPGAGHAAHLERPDAFSAALGDFLDEHLGERRLVERDA
jgi:2-succinyl-6-hydroxy-2,4-cyclohexadiene-1-carboxylate synthase